MHDPVTHFLVHQHPNKLTLISEEVPPSSSADATFVSFPAGAYYPAQPQYSPSVQPAPVMISPAQQQQQAPPPQQPPAQPQGPPKRERKPVRCQQKGCVRVSKGDWTESICWFSPEPSGTTTALLTCGSGAARWRLLLLRHVQVTRPMFSPPTDKNTRPQPGGP